MAVINVSNSSTLIQFANNFNNLSSFVGDTSALVSGITNNTNPDTVVTALNYLYTLATTEDTVYSNDVTFQKSITVTNDVILESGEHRITSNDGAGNWQIRIGHDYGDTNAAAFTSTITGIPGLITYDQSLGEMKLGPISSVSVNNGVTFTQDQTYVLKMTYGLSGLKWGTNTVWHSGNDGHTAGGTGVDADLLDGQHGDYYAAVSGDTFTGVMVFNAQATFNQGGYISAFTGNIASLVGGSTFGQVIYGPQAAHVVVALRENDPNDSFSIVSGGGNWNTDNAYDTLELQVKADGTFTHRGAKVWTADNDGVGSTLDADFLDGLQTSSSGDYWGVVPYVSSTGALDIGRYLDFHNSDADISDYNVRLDTAGGSTGLYINGNRILTQADEGSGNGLDADTVDNVELAGLAQKSGTVAAGRIAYWASSTAVTGSTNFIWDETNKYLKLSAKNTIASYDGWLRLNPGNPGAYTSGIYCGTSNVRTDGQFSILNSDTTTAFIVSTTTFQYQGSNVLTTADEGSGNGIDSDTVDGYHVGKSGDRWNVIPYVNASGNLEAGKTIDFHNSDADTADYAARIDTNGTSGTTANLYLKRLGDATFYKILTEADEGSGKGIDADTVDNLHASSFVRANANDVISNNIYTQWGDGTGGSARLFHTSVDNTFEIQPHDGLNFNSAHSLVFDSGVDYWKFNSSLYVQDNITIVSGKMVLPVSTTGDITNNAGEIIRVDGTSSVIQIFANSTEGIRVSSTITDLRYGGAVKLATSNTGVDVTGTLTATGNVAAYSDPKLKNFTYMLYDSLNKVTNLSTWHFKWNDFGKKVLNVKEEDNKSQIGLDASEVQVNFPEVVGKDKNGVLTVDYSRLTVVLIDAIRELKQKVDNLELELQRRG